MKILKSNKNKITTRRVMSDNQNYVNKGNYSEAVKFVEDKTAHAKGASEMIDQSIKNKDIVFAAVPVFAFTGGVIAGFAAKNNEVTAQSANLIGSLGTIISGILSSAVVAMAPVRRVLKKFFDWRAEKLSDTLDYLKQNKREFNR